MNRIIWLLVLLLTTAPTLAGTLIYNGKPLDIQIPKGKEIVVRFEEPQLVGRPSMSQSFIGAEAAGNYVVLSGVQETHSIRHIFRGVSSGQVIIASVSVKEGVEAESEILVKSALKGVVSTPVASDGNAGSGKKKGKISLDDRAKIVVRYVNQDHGPKSAIEPTPFPVRAFVSNYIGKQIRGLYRGGALIGTVKNTYKGGGMVAYIVLMENISKQHIEFDPRYVRGNWHSIQPWKTEFRPGEAGVVLLMAEGSGKSPMLDVVVGG